MKLVKNTANEHVINKELNESLNGRINSGFIPTCDHEQIVNENVHLSQSVKDKDITINKLNVENSSLKRENIELKKENSFLKAIIESVKGLENIYQGISVKIKEFFQKQGNVSHL